MERLINQAIQLKMCLLVIPKLVTDLNKLESTYFLEIRQVGK